ncbi:MAG: hypothetical protein LQ339_007401 [Xanthoria mediterranea]|nr:MAG: hypothetical protein LQ339_007401 [Xanthoria mediterranea]
MRCITVSYLLQLGILICLYHSGVVPSGPLPANKGTLPSASALNVTASRKVHVHTLLYLFASRRAISRKSGKPILGGQASILVEGTQTDGPLVLELDFTPAPLPSRHSVIAIKSHDRRVAKSGEPFTPTRSPDTLQWVLPQGETSLTNREIFDHRAGTGLIADAWMEDPVYRMGLGTAPNTCYEFVERTLRRMHLNLDPVTRNLFENRTEYYTSYSQQQNKRVPEAASIVEAPAGSYVMVNTRVFNVDFEYNPKAPSVEFERTQHLPRNGALLTPATEVQ